MIEPLFTPADLRAEKKRLRFDDPSPVCAKCGLTDIRCLHAVKAGGKRKTILCANDHAKRKRWSEEAMTRRQKELANAGYSDASCIVCEENDMRTICLHHVACEVNAGIIGPLCANCHDIQSDAQEDFPVDFREADPNRGPLALQAAFELGLAALMSAMAIAEAARDDAHEALMVFYFLIAGALVAWAIWNIAADAKMVEWHGSDYGSLIPAPVPR